MVRVWESPPDGHNGTTTLTFLDWKRQTDIFEALSVECATRAAVTTNGNPTRIVGQAGVDRLFSGIRRKAQLGRTFAPGEDRPGAAPVVVLSHAFWRTQFGGDPGVLNRDLMLDGEPHRIIGVLPAGSFDRDNAVFWEPLIFAKDQLNRGQHWLNPIGRLRPGVSIEQARARMNILRASLNDVIYQKDWGFTVDPFAQMLVGDTLRRSIYLVFWSGADGVADRLRERGEPVAGQRSNPAERDGAQDSVGRRPQPFDCATADREPGAVYFGRRSRCCPGRTSTSCRRPFAGGITAVYRRYQPWIYVFLVSPPRP